MNRHENNICGRSEILLVLILSFSFWRLVLSSAANFFAETSFQAMHHCWDTTLRNFLAPKFWDLTDLLVKSYFFLLQLDLDSVIDAHWVIHCTIKHFLERAFKAQSPQLWNKWINHRLRSFSGGPFIFVNFASVFAWKCYLHFLINWVSLVSFKKLEKC